MCSYTFIKFYRKSIRGLSADLKNGNKVIFRTRISKKAWKGHDQFELFIDDLPKILARKKFIYTSADTQRFHGGDIIVLEYLERSGVLLRMYVDLSIIDETVG